MMKIKLTSKKLISPQMMRRLCRVKRKISKHSPEILLATGLISGGATIVLACKETLKVPQIANDHAEKMAHIHEDQEKELCSVQEIRKDTFLAYRDTGIRVLRTYAPAIGMGMISVTCILASNKIMRERHAALVSAYAALSEKFRDYRARVSERFGDEVEEEIRKGVRTVTVDETVTDKKGKEKVEQVEKKMVGDRALSQYARAYDDGCKNWRKDPEFNLMTLRAQETYCNNLLRAQGYLFLSDVYDMLGFKQTKASRRVGWIYDPKNPALDNFVDFGIYNIDSEGCRNFVNGYESVIWLDFNVDGPIDDFFPD